MGDGDGEAATRWRIGRLGDDPKWAKEETGRAAAPFCGDARPGDTGVPDAVRGIDDPATTVDAGEAGGDVGRSAPAVR